MDDRVQGDIATFFESRTIQEALSGLGIFAIDLVEGRVFPSDLWLRCGYSPADMNPTILPDILHPDDKEPVLGNLEDLFAGRKNRFEAIFRMRAADGAWLWVSGAYTVIYRDVRGVPRLYLGHDQDITAIKKSEEDQRRRVAEIETLRQVVADVNGGLDLGGTVSLILEHTRRVIPHHKGTVQILERDQLRVVGSTGFADRQASLALRFPFPQPPNPVMTAIQSRMPVVCNDVVGEFAGFHQVEGEDLVRSWMGIPLIAGNEVIGLLTLDCLEPGFYDARHLEMAEIFGGHVALAIEKARTFEQMRTMALTDQLTGAGNRHSLQLQGPFFLEKAKRDQKPLVALMADLDEFKKVNDRHGHDVGDRLLVHVASVIRTSLRGYDLFFRYGGEEFLILLPDTEPAAALEVAERIRLAMDAPPGLDLGARPTLSLGLGSLVPGPAATLTDLIKVADLALYQAKAGGRNRTEVRIG